MNKLNSSELLKNEEYLKVREDRRKEIIALKKKRRIEVGPRLSFTFENRETVAYQIQEMMRIENITDEKKIQFEVDMYNDLIPDPGCLSATLFIEIPQSTEIRDVLDTFQGLDSPDTVYMTLGKDKVSAEFEEGHSREDRISAVHYVRFCLSQEQASKFADAQVEIHVNHPRYKASTALTSEQKEQLATDLL
ncbi:DUF3501 family protein [bacterium]|nr:DUF3501 family protein [bacterium]MCI0603350.1 DUF3501 family protein [bacterium]